MAMQNLVSSRGDIPCPFEYQPLNESNQIRLLEVERCDDLDAPLRGKLHHVDLEDDGRLPYVALSYTWGNASTVETIVIEGRTMLIQQNLARALQYFRSSSAIKYIWADALCINQKDNSEKSSQIPLMTRIYREASQVRVWFGDHAQTMTLMKSIRAIIRNIVIRSIPDSIASEMRELLPHLTQLPWFSRRWIIQEIAVNPTVTLTCGYLEVSWARLVPIVQEVCKDAKPQRPEIQPLLSLARIWENLAPEPNFSNNNGILQLMKEFRDFECMDGRDRIAALIGLASDIGPNSSQHQPHFRIDYAKSVESNYIAFAEALASMGQLDGLFDAAWQCRSSDYNGDLPSWVPDWRNFVIKPWPWFPKDNELRLRYMLTQRSQAGMHHRFILPIAYVTDSHATSTMPKWRSWTNEMRSKNKGRKHHNESSTVFSADCEGWSLSQKIRWVSTFFRLSQHVESRTSITSFGEWLVRAATELFAWLKEQPVSHSGYPVTFPLVLGHVLNFVALSHLHEPTKYSQRLEVEALALPFTLGILSHMDSDRLFGSMMRCHDSRLFLRGHDGAQITAYTLRALGLAPVWAEIGDRIARLQWITVTDKNNKWITSEYEKDNREGSVHSNEYVSTDRRCLFRRTSVARVEEDYIDVQSTTVKTPDRTSATSTVQGQHDLEEHHQRNITMSSELSYTFVGLCSVDGITGYTASDEPHFWSRSRRDWEQSMKWTKVVYRDVEVILS
ncbi:HET-domain-containing protein [Pyrenochaeta sp. DS3sAY3a]|nr:HET-domain-containing protein [Pyrenochaeta sp. DS3sAY3a]